jgi:hypothetical protein
MSTKTDKKITANLPKELLARAMEASGEGLTPTLRRGLELVAAQRVFRQILVSKGKYPRGIGLNVDESRKDKDR